VTVVGDFNGWNEQATPLKQTESGWLTTLELDAGRSYQYLYLVNGKEWHNDWQADSYARNRFGGDSSVVTTPSFIEQPSLSKNAVPSFNREQRPALQLVPTH
jgi:1,4-alpha-glucan branching enzyme